MGRESEIDQRMKQLIGGFIDGSMTDARETEFHQLSAERARAMRPNLRCRCLDGYCVHCGKWA